MLMLLNSFFVILFSFVMHHEPSWLAFFFFVFFSYVILLSFFIFLSSFTDLEFFSASNIAGKPASLN